MKNLSFGYVSRIQFLIVGMVLFSSTILFTQKIEVNQNFYTSSPNSSNPPIDPPGNPPTDPPGNNSNQGNRNRTEISEKMKSENVRTIQVTQGSNGVNIESFRQDQSDAPKLNVQINYNPNFLDTMLNLYINTTAGTPKFRLHFRITNLIEYVDTDRDFVYKEGIDSIVQTYQLNGFYLANSSSYKIDDDSTLYYYQVNSSDNVMSVRYFITEQFYTYSNGIITPTQVKFDFIITSFPFQSNQSRLALPVNFIEQYAYQYQSQTYDEKYNFTQNETGVKFGDEEQSGYFSWQNYAYSNNSYQAVVFSSNSDSGAGNELKQVFYLNYNQSNYIFHDPRLGYTNILSIPEIIGPDNWFKSIYIGFGILAGILLVFGLMMTKQEYRDYLLNRVLHLNTAPHRLNMKEVLENEIRSQIIDLIMDDPGIHYSELLRETDVSPSSLAWHLDILETYKIIHKQRIGNYLIFYPYLDKNPFANIDPTLVKSKQTLDIFHIIGENPGIFISKIARRLDIHRKTVKYHIDKLMDAELIETKKEGRKLTLFVKKSIIGEIE